jgi:hypothetical protein
MGTKNQDLIFFGWRFMGANLGETNHMNETRRWWVNLNLVYLMKNLPHLGIYLILYAKKAYQ